MPLEIEVVLLSKAELKQIVIKRLLRNVYFTCCLLKSVPHQLAIPLHSVVETTPKAHFSNYILNSSLFCPLLLIFFICFIITYLGGTCLLIFGYALAFHIHLL